MKAEQPGKMILRLLGDRTATSLANSIGVTRGGMSNTITGKSGVSVDMALRLEGEFGVSAETWLSMQNAYDLEIAREKDNG